MGTENLQEEERKSRRRKEICVGEGIEIFHFKCFSKCVFFLSCIVLIPHK